MLSDETTAPPEATRDPRAVVQGLRIGQVQPAYRQVAEQLGRRIVDGSLAAGDKLPPESELAEIFGVSRSTIRDGLRVLASRDLIYTTRGVTGGTFVAVVSLEQVGEYLETSLGLMFGANDISDEELTAAREALEAPIVRLAAERRQQSHIDALRAALERERITGSRDIDDNTSPTFHRVLVDAAGGGLLGMLASAVFRILATRNLVDDLPTGYWERIDQDHEAILKAVEDGDPDAAEAAMRAHMVSSREGRMVGPA